MTSISTGSADHRDFEINWLHFALQAGGVGAWDWNLAEDTLVWNPAMRSLLGFGPDYHPTSADFFAHVHAEDRPGLQSAIEAATRHGAELNTEFRFVREDGEVIWLAAIGRCFHNTAGEAIRLRGVNLNVTERHRAKETEMAFMREMVHRLKNTITLVSGIVTLTERQVETVPEFADLLKSRLKALAETSNMLIKTDYHHADLGSIVSHALQTFNIDRRISTTVPALHLKEQAAQLIALMLHELATNALKHGALAHQGGRVSLTILPPEGENIGLEWRETGVSMKGQSKGAGDGMEILTKAVRYLCAEPPELVWNEDGILYRAQLRASAVLAGSGSGKGNGETP